MNSSITTEQVEFTASALTHLEECSEASVYASGYIQPNGVLVVLQEPDLKILQVSETVEQFLGVPATTVVGKSLYRLFSRLQVQQIAEFLQQDDLELWNPFELKARSRIFRGTLSRTNNVLLLEIEPQLSNEKLHSLQFYHRLQATILSLRSATSSTDLVQKLAQRVKALTGFDRVMIYRFEADDHGVVIAEEKESHLESYLGLHFPTIDIPVPARKLFLRNWVRQIPNVNYTLSRLIPAEAFPEGQPLDLSNCVLRGVSPYHIEYLQNMGVGGSLTVSLIDDQHLWGLIACHHSSPKQVDYETRKTCEFLGQFASIELVHQQERELLRYQTQVKAIQDKLQQAFLREPNFIQQVLTRNSSSLLHLVQAEGVAIALDERISLIGQTPPLEAVQDLLSWLARLNQPEFYFTDCLARPYPPARVFKDAASGILAISIVLHQRSYHIVWFRPEQIQTVHWAGNPKDAVTIDELGNLNLCPRKSFELWKETVQETSLPWQTAEIEAARMMRSTLMLAVLEFSQIALEQSAERAAIANRAKSQFLAKMSHELRTPLNAILGFAQVMNRSPNIPTEFQEPVRIINRSGEHLLALINDVLEMSRIEAGQLLLTERHFNLHRLLRSLQEMFALKAVQKGLTLVFEEDPDVPCYVCSDEAKLRQILINLISNAIKFTTQGGVLVRVSVARTQPTERGCTCYPNAMPPCHSLNLSFIVKDTGCGIEHRDWGTIFEAFMQTERGRQAEGTGLGLCISRQFARLMGGDITVQSTVNQGSTFNCQVLIYQPEAVALLQATTGRLIIGLEPNQPTYRILVAEDAPENRQLLLTLLESIGFEVKTVENGIEAIAQWQTWQPDLILMDLEMPEMNGLEATQQIRLHEVAKQRPPTPIIALTAYAFEADRQASLEAGCNEHIAKPFNETVLFETIARYLNVGYRYCNQSPEVAPAVQKNLTAQDLEIMPDEWLIKVHEAALDLQDERLYQLVAQIPNNEQWLIEAMISLVDTLQFEAIASLTQS
ncbi:response regulator [Leptolyngbya ohadii]|uniref:response regulator n=1 Tax=Leptolyngbya ohadii TaxID=1962290 RepID=UPI000B5A0270|nr:response regulator [Leptolyngbya ohadii]